jgi:hypothetical protein
MSSKNTVVDSLNNSQNLKIYWIFLYSYSDDITKTLPDDKILLFPVSVYTMKSGALPTLMTGDTLDLDSDEHLDMIITQFKLNYVRSVSEMVISKNTNLIAIQIDSNKKLKGYKKQNQIYFHTLDRSPIESIYEGRLKNEHLLQSVSISIGSRNIVNTNVTLERIFIFLFKDHFEALYNFNTAVNNTVCRDMCNKRIRKDREDREDREEEDGYDSDSTNDSKLSLYSYNKKYNIKDI